MFCPNCGKQTDDNAAFCDSCGASLNSQQQYQPYNQPGPQNHQNYQQSYQAPPDVPETSPTAIWSLVLGILSYFCCGCLAAIGAVICGHIALNQINESEGKFTGRGMAIAGLIMGYIMIALSVLVILFYMIIAVTNPDLIQELIREFN